MKSTIAMIVVIVCISDCQVDCSMRENNTNLIQTLETANQLSQKHCFRKEVLEFVVMKKSVGGHNHGVNVKFNCSSKRECAVTTLDTHCLKNGWANRPNL